MKTHLDWAARDTNGVGDACAGIPATGGNHAKAVVVCMNMVGAAKAEGRRVMAALACRLHGPSAHGWQRPRGEARRRPARPGADRLTAAEQQAGPQQQPEQHQHPQPAVGEIVVGQQR